MLLSNVLVSEISASVIPERLDLRMWSIVPSFWSSWCHCCREFANGISCPDSLVYHLLKTMTDFRPINSSTHDLLHWPSHIGNMQFRNLSWFLSFYPSSLRVLAMSEDLSVIKLHMCCYSCNKNIVLVHTTMKIKAYSQFNLSFSTSSNIQLIFAQTTFGEPVFSFWGI